MKGDRKYFIMRKPALRELLNNPATVGSEKEKIEEEFKRRKNRKLKKKTEKKTY